MPANVGGEAHLSPKRGSAVDVGSGGKCGPTTSSGHGGAGGFARTLLNHPKSLTTINAGGSSSSSSSAGQGPPVSTSSGTSATPMPVVPTSSSVAFSESDDAFKVGRGDLSAADGAAGEGGDTLGMPLLSSSDAGGARSALKIRIWAQILMF